MPASLPELQSNRMGRVRVRVGYEPERKDEGRRGKAQQFGLPPSKRRAGEFGQDLLGLASKTRSIGPQDLIDVPGKLLLPNVRIGSQPRSEHLAHPGDREPAMPCWLRRSHNRAAAAMMLCRSQPNDGRA